MAFCCTLLFQSLVFHSIYAVHDDTPLNLTSVTPKDGGDQYSDVHPRKTLPASGMFEEPVPPPLPTKSVLLHCVSLCVIPVKFLCKKYNTFLFNWQLFNYCCLQNALSL